VFALLTMHPGNRQFRDDVKVPFLTDHTVNFDSKITEAENPFVRQLRKQLCPSMSAWSHPRT
jgi:hypothetical protein